MITHVVLLKFTDTADREPAKRMLEALATTVPQITSLTVGVDCLGRDGAYDVALITTHDDEQGLQGYVEHPDHVEVVNWLRPRLAARAAVDF